MNILSQLQQLVSVENIYQFFSFLLSISPKFISQLQAIFHSLYNYTVCSALKRNGVGHITLGGWLWTGDVVFGGLTHTYATGGEGGDDSVGIMGGQPK